MNVFRAGFDLLRKSTPIVGAGAHGGWGGMFQQPASGFDYVREAGAVYDNLPVSLAIRFLSRKGRQAPLRLERAEADGAVVPVPDGQGLLRPLTDPNRHYGWGTLLGGAVLSLVVSGNAYLLKRRDLAGRLVGFWYVPHFQIVPRADRWPDGRANDGHYLITRYEFQPLGGGVVQDLWPSDVVHLRDALPNPRNAALGLSPVAAALRDVCTDNEAATFSAALLRNLGVPGVMVSPKGEALAPSEEQRSAFKALWDSFRRDGRGRPFIMPMPVDISTPAFSPEQMALEKVRSIPAERICAAVGLDPMALHLPSSNKTYANYAEAREAAVEDAVLPLLSDIGSQLTKALTMRSENAAPDFALAAGVQIGFDTSVYRELSEDRDKLAARVQGLLAAGVITVNEGRQMLGLSERKGGDVTVTEQTMGGSESAAKAARQMVKRAEMLARGSSIRDQFEDDV